MLLKFASLIAFDKFERFVLKKHRASLIAFDKFERFVLRKTPRASLIAFDKFGRFVLKKHRASLIAFDKLERFVVTTQVVIERQCTARCLQRVAPRISEVCTH